MLLADLDIRALCFPDNPVIYGWRCGLLHGIDKPTEPLIWPFNEEVSGNGIISYGLTSGGYDVRLDTEEIYVFKGSYGLTVDPKMFGNEEYKMKMFDKVENIKIGDKVNIPPNGYILAQTMEYINMPRWLKARAVGKSTLARSGILINTTPMEPEWEGHLTLEIANLTSNNAVVYAGEGCSQFEFELLTQKVEKSYKDKKGKYDKQKKVTHAIVK